MNLGELKAAIIEWSHRGDLASIVPTWITLATSVFNRDLRVPEMEARTTPASPIVAEFTGLPTGFLEIRGIYLADGTELRYLPAQQFAGVVGRNETFDDPIYTIEDFQLRFRPAPTASTPLTPTILYYERITVPASDGGDNWLMRDWPDLYLYGSLLHARAWMQADERLATVDAYKEALASVRRRKVAATGVSMARVSDVPSFRGAFDMTRGY